MARTPLRVPAPGQVGTLNCLRAAIFFLTRAPTPTTLRQLYWEIMPPASALRTYGLRRMHYVTRDRSERRLTPHPRSAIGRRLRLEQTHPVASRWIAAAAIVVLLVGVGVNVPQLVQVISEIPPIAEHFGAFVSPIQLPLWLNLTLGTGAALASMERGLRLCYHWMLDGLGN